MAGQHRSGLQLLEAPRVMLLVLQASPWGSGTAHAFKPPLEQSSRERAALGARGAGVCQERGLSEGPWVRAVITFLPLLGLID